MVRHPKLLVAAGGFAEVIQRSLLSPVFRLVFARGTASIPAATS